MFFVRKACAADAEAIVGILQTIVAERIYTAIETPWTVEEERKYLLSLSRREAFHVAEGEDSVILGYQSLDLYSPILSSMSHVAQVGTFLLPSARRQGVGKALFASTLKFASENGYRKIVIQVRSSNAGALRFYGQLGFQACGRLARQVRLGDVEDDETLMEFFL